jgi:hypothetical protein
MAVSSGRACFNSRLAVCAYIEFVKPRGAACDSSELAVQSKGELTFERLGREIMVDEMATQAGVVIARARLMRGVIRGALFVSLIAMMKPLQHGMAQ